jgi:hypothetical protein
MMRLVATLVISVSQLPFTQGDYPWLSRNANNSQAYVKFGDQGHFAGAGPPTFIEDKVKPWCQDASSGMEIPMVIEPINGDEAQGYHFSGPISAKPPFALSMNFTYGILSHGTPMLLKYYSNADMSTSPQDWSDLEKWGYQEFELLLKPHLTRDQCFPLEHSDDGASLLQSRSSWRSMHRANDSSSAMQNSTTCIDATVLWQGKPVKPEGGEIKFYNGQGVNIGTAQTGETGVAAVELPSDFGELFAKVKRYEMTEGEYEGTQYGKVGHYATAYTRSESDSSNSDF